MSRSVNMAYILRKSRERELYLKRIEENTLFYLTKYEEMYRKFKEEGYYEYIPEEMKQLRNDLNTIKNSVNYNIETAMQISKTVGNYVYNLRGYYKDVKTQIEDIAKKKQERIAIEQREAKSKISKIISNKLLEITDPIVRDFAYDLSLDLKRKSNDTNITEDEILKELKNVIEISTSKAVEWKKEHAKKNEKDNEREKIRTQIELLKQSKEKNNKVEKIIEELEIIKDNVNSMNSEEIKESISRKSDEAEKEVLDEKIRQEVVRSLYRTLNKEGFIVSNPQIDKDENIVILRANKPSGHRALCEIELDGRFSYKFDNYEGMSCLKDIEKVHKELENIYGIELTEKKVVWENPNRILKDANSMPSSKNNKIGGQNEYK